MKRYSGIELMEKVPTGQAIIHLALPMMVAMLVQAIYNMTDLFFIGQTGNSNMVAAISLIFPVFMLSQAIGNIFSIGGSSYISRLLGSKDFSEAKRTSSVSFYLSFLIGVFLTIFLIIFKSSIISFLGASQGTFNYANDYFNIIVVFMPFAIVSTTFSGTIRSEGATKRAMSMQLVGIILNIILDPIFILVFKLGTAGAAWATVIGQVVSFCYGFLYFKSKKTMLSIDFNNFKLNKKMFIEIFSIGIPAGISNIIMNIGNILGNKVASIYGDHVIAGFGVQMRIGSLCFMLVFALTMGLQPFAGYNYGAKNIKRLKEGIKITLIYSSAISIIGSIILYVFSDHLIRFFIKDLSTIQSGSYMLKKFVFGLFFIGIQVTLTTTFQALGKSVKALIIMLCRQLILFVPLIYILSYYFGFKGFSAAFPFSDVITAFLAIFLFIPLIKTIDNPDTLEIEQKTI